MGASDFETWSCGKNADEAFHRAVERARYDYGHAGYTGTIAEKHSYSMAQAKPMTGSEFRALMNELEASECNDGPEHRLAWVFDKWGDAGCVELIPDEKLKPPKGERVFAFFGVASC